MAGGAPITSTSNVGAGNDRNYTVPLTIITSLFFMWGFITCMNDILIPKLKEVFELSYTQAILVQFCFFGAYFIVSLVYFIISISSGDPIAKFGYKKAIVLGLLVSGIGCALFYPAATNLEYGYFLGALFILASGITILQIGANPYVALLGKPEGASSRLNLTQAFNSLGTTIAPQIGALLIFKQAAENISTINSAETVKMPYLGLAGLLFLLAILISISKLPKVTDNTEISKEKSGSAVDYRHLLLGVLCIFMYVGGEVSIGSFLVNYMGLENIAGLDESTASSNLSIYWGGAMIGRFFAALLLTESKGNMKWLGVLIVVAGGYLLGLYLTNWNWNSGLIFVGLIGGNIIAFLLGQSKPNLTLGVFGFIVIILLLIGSFADGQFAMWAMLSIGLFNSVMFPTIFTLAIKGLGIHTAQGSSLLVMAIVGGALVPFAQAWLADLKTVGLQLSFLFPVICYAYIAFYGFIGSKPKGPGIKE